MGYRRFEPPEALAPFVESLWLQESPASKSTAPPTRIVPASGVELVVCFGEPFQQLIETGGATPMPMALVAGQRTRGIVVRATGGTGLLIARCHPWAARALLRSEAECLVDGYAALTDLDSGEQARALAERVAESRTVKERVSWVERYLLEVFGESTPDPIMPEAVETLDASWGQSRIADLARDFSLSRRQLQRRFKAATGIGAKRFARLVRFQKAVGSLRSGRTWSEVVESCGYVDQAHLIREIQAFLSCTPPSIALRPVTPLMRFFNQTNAAKLNTTVYL